MYSYILRKEDSKANDIAGRERDPNYHYLALCDIQPTVAGRGWVCRTHLCVCKSGGIIVHKQHNTPQKKLFDIPVPSRDVTYQTLSGREL